VANIDVGGKKIYDFLVANYDVPKGVTGFTIECDMECATSITWRTYLYEKDETKNITESLKDTTEPTE
jgi:ferredoxin-fold anticodon binding domain-containing protein